MLVFLLALNLMISNILSCVMRLKSYFIVELCEEFKCISRIYINNKHKCQYEQLIH